MSKRIGLDCAVFICESYSHGDHGAVLIMLAYDIYKLLIVSFSHDILTREQALTALTIGCAKQMFIENERGSVLEGKYADFLLVDKDVLSCPEDEIHTAKPMATYFEGKKFFSV